MKLSIQLRQRHVNAALLLALAAVPTITLADSAANKKNTTH